MVGTNSCIKLPDPNIKLFFQHFYVVIIESYIPRRTILKSGAIIIGFCICHSLLIQIIGIKAIKGSQHIFKLKPIFDLVRRKASALVK